MPCEVYLIGEPNAWVADRGGLMGFGSRRVMGLGLPLLAALNVSQLRAILAHEFAHYYGGDTKLGPWLHRTQMALIRTFQNMGSVGGAMRVAAMALLYSVVFGVLKWYWLFFLRAINFVSRRQEFRADELACIVAGPQALVGGLRIVHGASMAWPLYWHEELAPLLRAGRLPPATSGFSQFLAVPSIAKEVGDRIDKEIQEGKTEPYDSHPPLRDRIAAAQKLPREGDTNDNRPAWSLLDDADVTELAFFHAVNPGMPEDFLRRVAWEEQGSKVLIPSWSSFVGGYATLLEGMTVDNLFASLGKIPTIAPQIRDPKGMLLTPDQRVERARELLGAALALALTKNGWHLHAAPGEFCIGRNGEQIDPFMLVRDLSNGTVSAQAWVEKCQKLNLIGIPLKPTQPANPDAEIGQI